MKVIRLMKILLQVLFVISRIQHKVNRDNPFDLSEYVIS